MNKPLISVIIPTKNEEAYLENTLKQYYDIKKAYCIEIIIADGDSNDNTLLIANKYADIILLSTKKENIAIGRNRGAAAASGEILFHTDADVIIPNIDSFINILIDSFCDSSVLALTTNLRVYPNKELITDKVAHFIFNFCIKYSILFGAFLSKGECQIVRKDSFDLIGGYNEKIIAGEDCDLFYRINKVGKIIFLNKLVVYHSPRRFRNLGYPKVLCTYIQEGLSLFFRKKSFSKEWSIER